MSSAGPVKPTAVSRTTRITQVSTSNTRTPPDPSIYATRVGLGQRALGIVDGDVIVWFWIGTHAEHDRLLRTL
jgi:hypothetical protein